MSSFTQTRELERSLMKLLTGSVMLAKLNMTKVKVEWFTSPERKFIVGAMMEVMKTSKAILTRSVFEYMVGAQVSDSERSTYISEWNFIEALTTNENIEVLISKLEEARVGQEVLGMAEEVAELLEEGRVVDALAALKMKAVTIGGASVEDRPVIEITDYQHRLDLIKDKQAHPEKYRGMKIGFDSFDNNTGGIFINELLLIAGITGLGKSTLVKQICSNIVRLNPGKNVLHIANEEHLEQVEFKYDSNLSGVHYRNFKLADITEEEVEKWTDGMHRMKEKVEEGKAGRIFVKEVPAFTDATLIEQTYRELEQRGIKIHVIVIDHLPHLKPIQQAWGENDERSKAASDCKELARSLHTAVIVPTQAATEVEEKQNKGRRAGKLDVYGSKGQIHVSNTFMIITSKGADESQIVGKDVEQEWERDVYWLCDIKKQRDGAPFWFHAKHFVKNGRVIEVKEDDMSKPVGKDKDDEDAAINDVINNAEPDKPDETDEPKSTVEPDIARSIDDTVGTDEAPKGQESPSEDKDKPERNDTQDKDAVASEGKQEAPKESKPEPELGGMAAFLRRKKG